VLVLDVGWNGAPFSLGLLVLEPDATVKLAVSETVPFIVTVRVDALELNVPVKPEKL
jgi:hypothetical protein